jgi:hypothetical protein
MPEFEPQDGSVASALASRYVIQSLSMLRLRASRKMCGRCLASQRSRAGGVLETQSPTSA